MQAMGQLNIEGVGVRTEYFYSFVPIMFSTSPQQVFQVPNEFPMMFPKGIPSIASLYNISFAQSSPPSPLY
jgi:hypothetical protein